MLGLFSAKCRTSLCTFVRAGGAGALIDDRCYSCILTSATRRNFNKDGDFKKKTDIRAGAALRDM